MATTLNVRKILHRPLWEPCTPTPVSNGAGMFWRSLKLDSYNINFSIQVTSATVQYSWDNITDGYVQVAAPGTAFSGTFGAGACGRIHPVGTGPTARTATAGTTSTITTNLTIVRDLRNYKIRITGPLAGTAVGQELTILSNTIGANSVITVATQGGSFGATTTYQLLTPVFFMVNAGATGANIFQKYDWALNAWTVLSPTNLPASLGTDAWLVSTPGIVGGAYESSATVGQGFNGATVSTLTISGANWTANQWTNYQIRLTSGAGAGQVRTIGGNTSTTLTISGANWTTQPDISTAWQIEGNDDYLYLLGNNAVTMYRYSISSNAWVSMSPTSARAAAPGAGMSASWIGSSTDSAWTSKSAIKNGRYIYSFRGAAGSVLDIFDIAGGTSGAGTWVSGQAYGNAQETFTTGQVWEYDGRDNIYGVGPTGRGYRFNVILNALEPITQNVYPQGTATIGDKLLLVPYADGATRIDYLYHWMNTGTVVFRIPISLFTY